VPPFVSRQGFALTAPDRFGQLGARMACAKATGFLA
jgi:hypothetical protein